jgi:hypothetical protein
MISISTRTQNTSGALIIKDKASETDRYPARTSRSATLDGGAVIVHSGYSDGDRTITVYAELTEADADILRTIHQTETIVNISLPDGFYAGAISDLFINHGMVEMQILIESKES